MQIPILRRGGDSGTDLNFTVVGGRTQPENPKENTIWVNTDQEITGWMFSASQPEAPYEGMVWLMHGHSSQVDFNALEDENEITIGLGRIRQYADGAFVIHSAQVYQNGSWAGIWNGVLYDYGTIPSSYCGVRSVQPHSSYGIGTGTFNSDHWYYYITNNHSIGLQSKEKIDITGYKTLNVIYSGSASRFGLSTNTYLYNSQIAAAITSGNASLDLTNVTDGEYYITFGNYSGQGKTYSGYVYKLWLE